MTEGRATYALPGSGFEKGSRNGEALFLFDMYTIEDFQKRNIPEYLVITQHSRKRFQERGISIEDVRGVLQNGEIIEQYPDDKPFPSCLILSEINGRALHVVASIDGEYIYVITAYIPSAEKWQDGWRIRREKQE